MKKTAIILMMTGVLSKIFGFGRYITLAFFYGTSNVSDAYLISLTIPMTILEFIGQAISTTFIPIYNKILAEETREKAQDYINNLINILFFIATIAISVSVITAPWLVKLFASGFEGETFYLSVNLTRAILVGMYFSILMSVLRGFLHSCENYIMPSLIGLPFNIIIMVSIVISSKSNVYVLAIGTVIAMFSQFAMILYASYKEGYRYRFIVDVKDTNFIKMMRLAVPTVVSTSVRDINKLVDRTLASRVVVGGISALSYASRLNQFIQQIFVMSLVTVLYPLISKMAAENNIKGLKKALSEVVNAVHLMVIPATIGALIFAEPIVKLLFGRGAFNLDAIAMTSSALIFYSIGMVGLGLREVLSRVFFSLQDTKTPMINASIGMGLNIILNFVLVQYLGLGGLALATSIAAIFTTILMFISLRKKIGPFGMKSITISFFKMLMAALVMGGVARLSFNVLLSNLSQNLSLIIAIGIGAIIYFAIIYFMKIDDVDVIVSEVKRKLKGSKERSQA